MSKPDKEGKKQKKKENRESNLLRIIFAWSKYSHPASHIVPSAGGPGSIEKFEYRAAIVNIDNNSNLGIFRLLLNSSASVEFVAGDKDLSFSLSDQYSPKNRPLSRTGRTGWTHFQYKARSSSCVFSEGIRIPSASISRSSSIMGRPRREAGQKRVWGRCHIPPLWRLSERGGLERRCIPEVLPR